MALSLAAMGIIFMIGANHVGVLILISLLVYIISFAIGMGPVFWLYALLAVASFIFCWFLVPETNGRNLENIEKYWKNGRKWE